MSFLLKEIVKNRLRQLTTDELLHYANQYGFSITRKQADQIVHYMQTNNVDIFSKEAAEQAYQKIAEITDLQTANKLKALFDELIKTYGLESYFN